MKLIPGAVTRVGGRALLKMNASSPTILVVAGVVGLGATAVLAAKATRRLDPIVDQHQKDRALIETTVYQDNNARTKDLVKLYTHTSVELTKLYGPTLFIGTTSAIAVLGGHRILHGRQLATMAAYSGLADQFNSYRKRVMMTLGEDVERGIFDGAHGVMEEDPDHKGEYNLVPKFDSSLNPENFLRPWFDETNPNWTNDANANYLFLKGVQAHMNRLLEIRGWLFVNDVYDALYIPRTGAGQAAGWLYNSAGGDNFVDFGFMSGIDPHTVAFRNHVENTVRLNLNAEGIIWDKI